MVFELVFVQLLQVVFAQDHVLDKLSELLVELDYVGPSVDEVLDLWPFEEVVLGFLGTSAERADQFAKDLRSFESWSLWLFNSQNVRVHV
jgi:hypothetical protein